MSHTLWNSFEHHIYREIQQRGCLETLKGKTLLLALSGGVDSVAALVVLDRLARTLGLQLIAAHIHHGPGLSFRDEALCYCEDLCRLLEIPFVSRKSERDLGKSEDSLRDYRWRTLHEMLQEVGADLIVTAHHEEDLLETRLLRLIRGTGMQGLAAMDFYKPPIFRPLLSVSKQALTGYLQERKIAWIEDPTNDDPRYLRNWLRQEWLPELEKRSPGAVRAFARSLQLLCESVTPSLEPEGLWQDAGFSRPVFTSLSSEGRRRVVAQYLLRLGVRDFHQGQIHEIIKLLDKPQVVHTFCFAGLEWQVNAQQVVAQTKNG